MELTEQKGEKLSAELRAHYEEMLVEIYDSNPEEVKKLSDEMLVYTIREKEKVKLSNVKNPNSFWILKSLPPPKLVKPTTSSKAGLWVVLSLAIALLVFLAIALLAVFLR